MGKFRPSYGFFVTLCLGQVLLGRTAFSATSEPADSSQAAVLMDKGYRFSRISQYDSSLACYRKASEILAPTKHRSLYIHCLNKLADSYLRKTSCDSALKVLGSVLAIEEAEFGGRGLETAETHALMGYAYSYQDKTALAIEHLNKTLAMRIEELGEDHPLVGESYYLLGTILRKKGNLDQALEALEQALRIQRNEYPPDSISIANTLGAMGSVCQSKGEYSLAVDYFSEALSLLATSGERSAFSQATCLFYLAVSLQECGDVVGAIGNYKKALNLSRQLFGDNHQTVSACYAKLAELYEISGDYENAIDLSDEALNLMIKLNGEQNSGVAAIYNILAAAYSGKNETDKALQYSLKALSTQRSALGEDHPDMASYSERAADIYEARQQYPEALQHYRDALQGRLRLGGSEYRLDIGRIYLKIGKLYRDTGEYTQALEFLNKSLHILTNAPENNRSLLAATYKALGDVYCHKHDFTQALSAYDRSISLLQSEPRDSSGELTRSSYPALNVRDLLESLTAKAQMCENRYRTASHDVADLQTALSEYERAVELMGQLRRTFKGRESKLFLQGERLSLYEGGLRTSIQLFNATAQQRYEASAFWFAEKSKANVLFDAIQEAESRHVAGIPDSLLEKEQRLRRDITLCETQLLKERESNGVADSTRESLVQHRLFTLRQEYQRLLELFETSFPAYYDLKYRNRPATLASTQGQLDPQTCLLEYFVGDQSVYILSITRDSFDALALPKTADFEQSIASFCQSIRTIDQRGYVFEAAELYKLLIQPVRKRLEIIKRLVIIPDGILYQVPFGALIPPGQLTRKGAEGNVDFTRLPYLVNHYEISYAYSSSFFTAHAHQPEEKGPETSGFVGFAPVFRDSVTKGYVLASNQSLDALELSELRSFTVDGKMFKELPFSEEEVRSITTDFAHQGGPSVGFFHSRATKENFMKEAGKFAHIHIATHGYMNENHPRLSALVFAPTPDELASDDAILYAGETYNLTLNADLLVLSSCESGAGKVVRGEGMMGMTRGFFYAGARNIVYSLWKVFDKQTTELMKQFYAHVLDGDTYSSALRKAKLTMVQNPRTAFPSKWAGFVLLGE